MKRIVSVILIFLLGIFLFNMNSCMAVSLSASAVSLKVGENKIVTLNANGMTGTVNVSSSDSDIASVNAEGNWVENNTININIVGKSQGAATITVSWLLADSTTGKESSDSRKINVTVNSNNSTPVPQNNTQNTSNTNQNANNNKKSNNANLSNLGIRPNDFSGFKAGTTTYNVTVPENVETIEVYAKAQDSKAKISGIGKKELQKGKNTASVTVTAEDGTKKTYTINITRKEEKEDEKDEEQKEEENTNEETIEKKGLAKLEIENVSLSPDFQSNIYEYTVKYIGEDTKLNINAVATNEEYTVDVTGNEELKEGENIITILVSDTQSNNIATYQITVNKSLVNEEISEQEQEQKDENQKKMIIYGGIAIGIFVLIIIFIIRHKRNKKWEEEYDIPFYNANDNKNNQLEDFDENMKYKGNHKSNDNIQKENKKIMKEKYLDIYNRRDIELEKLEDEKYRKNKNRGKRFR